MPPPKPKTYTSRPINSRSKAFKVFQDTVSAPTSTLSSIMSPRAAPAPTTSKSAEAAARKALGSKSKNTIVKRPRTATISSPTSAAVAAAFALRKGKKPKTAVKGDENAGAKTKQTEKEKKPEKKVELNEDEKAEPRKSRIKDRYTSLPRPLPARLRIISNEDEDIVTFNSPSSSHSRRGSWDRVTSAFFRRSYTQLSDHNNDDEIDQLPVHDLRAIAGAGDGGGSSDNIPRAGYHEGDDTKRRKEEDEEMEEDVSGILSSREDELAVATNGCYRVGYVEGRRRIVRLSSGPVTRIVPEGYSVYSSGDEGVPVEEEEEEEDVVNHLGVPVATSTPMPEAKPRGKGRRGIVKKGSEEVLEPLVSGGGEAGNVAKKRGVAMKRGTRIVETLRRDKSWVREPSMEL